MNETSVTVISILRLDWVTHDPFRPAVASYQSITLPVDAPRMFALSDEVIGADTLRAM